MAKIMKRAQTGKNVPKGMVESEMFPGKMIPKSKSNYENGEYAKMLQAGKPAVAKPKAKIKPKAQRGIMSTKLKDVPGKVKSAVNRTVDKVKNTTVGDAAKFIANPSYSAAESAVEALRGRKAASKKPILKSKNGGKQMLKRADGSTSQRGLWDNIRAAKGSGKKPTAAMLKQEKKIKAKTKK